MEKIIFKDFPDITTPLNADNLNQLQTNVENALDEKQTQIDNLKMTALYEDGTGTTGTVTLSETSANFDYLEIYYERNDYYGSKKIHSPNGKTLNLDMVRYYKSNLQLIAETISISGTSITRGTMYYANVDDTSISATDSTYKILKVVGYKE